MWSFPHICYGYNSCKYKNLSVPFRLGKKLNRPLMILSHFRDRGNKEKLSGRKIHAVGRELLTDIRASNHARDSNLAFPPPTILRSTFFFELDLESCPSPFPRPLFARPSCLSHSRSLTRSLFLFHSHSLARSFSLTRARSLSLSRARSLSLSHSRSLARSLARSISLSLSVSQRSSTPRGASSANETSVSYRRLVPPAFTVELHWNYLRDFTEKPRNLLMIAWISIVSSFSLRFESSCDVIYMWFNFMTIS